MGGRQKQQSITNSLLIKEMQMDRGPISSERRYSICLKYGKDIPKNKKEADKYYKLAGGRF